MSIVPQTKPRVFVALSGGVDSAVSAALLKEVGYEVTGIFMKVWSPDWLPCAWPEERRDAIRVAAHLGIPFHTFDFTQEYKQHVVDYMIDEYRRGRVPNPDVMCNKFVKFDAFLKRSVAMEADFIATGHYSRVRQNTNHKEHKTPNDSEFRNSVIPAQAGIQTQSSYALRPTPYALLCGVDAAKDQSYFLWTLTQAQLSRTLFPIGHLTKPQVRDEARRFGLSVAEKKDSQGVCFLGKLDMKEFLKHYIKEVPGEVVNEKGEVIGHHEGVTFYTIGERRGFTITKKTPTDSPYYVVAKDLEKNQLVVAHRESAEHPTSDTHTQYAATHLDAARPSEYTSLACVLEQTNWSRGEAPDSKKTYQARIRYRQALQKCRISKLETGNSDNQGAYSSSQFPTSSFRVLFDHPQESVASGQSLVLYNEKGDECLGGGIIT